ncbi:hypothetical protein ABPG75_003906 [Micractinium tetrahymenae]
MARRGPKLSGLQRQVLSLYRSVLRVSRAKEQAGGESLAAYARQELDSNRGIDRKDIQRIEHLIRKGRRQLDLFQASEVTGIRLAGSSSSSSSSGGSSGGSATSSAAGEGMAAASNAPG